MTRRIRHIGVQLALIALLLRALLPPGWMPAVAGPDGLLVVLCTGYGPVTVALGADFRPQARSSSQHTDRHDTVCPFAAKAHLAPPAPAIEIAAPSAPQLATLRFAEPEEASLAARYSPHAPRGPPERA